jgi:hypothetical protein
MSWQKIGDVPRYVTKKVEELFAVALCFREWAPASNGRDFVGIVAFNHPRDWWPNDHKNAEVDECCRDIAQQSCDGEIQRGEGCVLWDDPLTPTTKKISRQISRNEKTLAAWCRGKYLIPLVIALAAHGAHETVQ